MSRSASWNGSASSSGNDTLQTRHTGELVAVDIFFVGTLKGVGKVYLQTTIDRYSLYAWGRFYPNKPPVTVVHLINEDVLTFFEKHKARITTILSNNGREYCGRPDKHPYELFLQLEEIENRTTKVRRPQSKGFVERLHRTLLYEHFRVVGRKKWYESISEMQTDLEAFLKHYNNERPHQGRNMKGRAPFQAFLDGLQKEVIGKPKKEDNAA